MSIMQMIPRKVCHMERPKKDVIKDILFTALFVGIMVLVVLL